MLLKLWLNKNPPVKLEIKMGNPVDSINDKGSENHAAGNKVKFECSKDDHNTTQPTVEDEAQEAEPNLEPVMPEEEGVGEDEEEAADEKFTAPEVGTAPRKKKSKKKSKSKRGLVISKYHPPKGYI